MAQLFRSPQLVKRVAADPAVEARIHAQPSRPVDSWKPAPLAPIVFKPPRPAADPVPKAPLTAEEMVRRTFLDEDQREPRATVQPGSNDGLADAVAADAETKIDWRLPALAAGALIVALAGGAWLGLESGNDNEDALPGQVAALKAAPVASAPVVEPSLTIAPVTAEAQPERPARAPAAAPVERVRAPLEIDLPEPQAETLQPAQAEAAVTEGTITEAAPAAAASTATLPLPDATVARTIRRIGYPCSAVASTAAMDSAGTFKVTCTSGHSYRAAPVRGRYRFKRL